MIGGRRAATMRSEVPKCRETHMTRTEVRYYKEPSAFRPKVNIRDFTSTAPIMHTAPNPDAHPRADAKTEARMMKSNVQMFPNEKDKDTFVATAKRSNAGQNMFMSSSALYGDAAAKPAQKKLSAVKVAEIGGS